MFLKGRHLVLLLSHLDFPQGTVPESSLFVIYINALPSRISSSDQLFADDCQLYKVIRNQKNAESLQTDLDHLQEWERDWRMVFNPDECKHIQITNKRNVMKTSFNIHGQTLIETSKAKYLVVTKNSKLPWNYDVPNGSRFISILFHLKYNQLSISQSRSSSQKTYISKILVWSQIVYFEISAV